VLRDVVWTLATEGKSEAEIWDVWQQIVARTPLTKPDKPWTRQDFQRELRGVPGKIQERAMADQQAAQAAAAWLGNGQAQGQPSGPEVGQLAGQARENLHQHIRGWLGERERFHSAIDEFSSHSDKLGPRWLYHRGVPSSTAARRAGAGRRLGEQELENRRAVARDLFTEMVAHGQQCYPGIELPGWAEAELGDIAVAATICRRPVPRDGYGRREIIGLPVTEEPYRLGYQIKALARGAMAIGYGAVEAVALARRCAMDTVPPVRVRVLWALQDGRLLTAAAIGKMTATDRKVARRALEDLRALLITSCPAEDRSDYDDVSGVIYDEEGEPVRKLWKLSAATDEDAAERVALVRDVMGKLYARPETRPI
jgi:hypothetical protein